MTNEELVREVVTKVLGETMLSGQSNWWVPSGDSRYEIIFNPLTNPAHWMMVVERMLHKGWFFRLYMAPNGTITARFWFPFPDKPPVESYSSDERIGHAVCEAALKAVG